MPKSYYIIKVGNKEIKLFRPYINEELKIAFRSSNVGINNLVLEEGVLLKKIDNKRKIAIRFNKEENIEVLNEIIKIKNEIIKDLREYNYRLKNNLEPIIYADGVFLTPTILKNGEYSYKYFAGMLYYFSKRINKEVSFEEMQQIMKKIHTENPSPFPEFIDGEKYDAYYFEDIDIVQ